MSLPSTRRVPSRPSQSLDKTICSTVILLLLLLSLPVSCSLKSPPKAPQPRVGKQCNVLRCTYAAKVKVNFGQEDRVTYYHLPASPLLFCLSLALFLFDKKHTILLSLHPLFPNLLDLSPSSCCFCNKREKVQSSTGKSLCNWNFFCIVSIPSNCIFLRGVTSVLDSARTTTNHFHPRFPP